VLAMINDRTEIAWPRESFWRN